MMGVLFFSCIMFMVGAFADSSMLVQSLPGGRGGARARWVVAWWGSTAPCGAGRVFVCRFQRGAPGGVAGPACGSSVEWWNLGPSGVVSPGRRGAGNRHSHAGNQGTAGTTGVIPGLPPYPRPAPFPPPPHPPTPPSPCLAVFYKQRTSRFYPSICFALQVALMRLPFCLAESWVWTFMVGGDLLPVCILSLLLGCGPTWWAAPMWGWAASNRQPCGLGGQQP